MKILLVGSKGKMGQRVLAKADCEVKGIDKLGADYNNFNEINEKFDVLLDFSSTSALKEVIAYCMQNKTPLVSAVTGYSEKQMQELESLSQFVPVVHCGNYSLGINLMKEMSKRLAAALPQADIEIVETHHSEKTDAPSGSAKMLLESLKSVRDIKESYRNNKSGKRGKGEVGIHSLRGGTVIGEHSIIFFMDGERLELKHTAENRDIFALGALHVCHKIAGAKAGLYTFEDFI